MIDRTYQAELKKNPGPEWAELYGAVYDYIEGSSRDEETRYAFFRAVKLAREGRMVEAKWWRDWATSGIKEIQDDEDR